MGNLNRHGLRGKRIESEEFQWQVNLIHRHVVGVRQAFGRKIHRLFANSLSLQRFGRNAHSRGPNRLAVTITTI